MVRDYLEPNPIFFGISALILGMLIFRNNLLASTIAYLMGIFDLMLTNVLFVTQEYFEINIELNQVTTEFLWGGVLLMILGSIEAMLTDPEGRFVFLFSSLIVVIPMVIPFVILFVLI